MLPSFLRQPSGVKEVDDMMERLQEIRKVIVGGSNSRTLIGVSPFVVDILA